MNGKAKVLGPAAFVLLPGGASGLVLVRVGTLLVALVIACLRVSAPGRGAVWMFTGRWGLAPKRIQATWLVLTAMLGAGVAWLELAAAR